MKRPVPPVLLLAAVLAVAVVLRLPLLSARPMHADEAVQAFKFGDLLERGRYVYDPNEYHGPTLNYLTLPVAWMLGTGTLREVTEVDLRLMPALLGVAMVLLIWPLRRDLGSGAAAAAMLLAALSPSLVFYSRYYIAEPLLAFFTMGVLIAGWRFLTATARARLGWAVALGACLGMMHASKETFVIAVFAAVVGIAATVAMAGGEQRRRVAAGLRRAAPALSLAGAAAILSSVLLYSSFLSNPGGIPDSVMTYARYLGRAGGRADAAWHVHAWHYYASVLFTPQAMGGVVWTELLLLVLAVAGVCLGARRDERRPFRHLLVRFLAVYAAVTIAIYSAIPYKTPWCAMTFVQALALLGGVGAAGAVSRAKPGAARWATVLALVAGCGHLAWQAGAAAFRANDDRTCPYAYVQTTVDVPLFAETVTELAASRSPQAPVQVMASAHDYWPLPWYFRDLERVGYYDRVPGGGLAPTLVLSPDLEPDLIARLFAPEARAGLYVDMASTLPGARLELRPNVPLRAYVRADLWEASNEKGGRR